MNWLAERLLAQTDWDAQRTLMGSASDVPEAVRRLASTTSEDTARDAYWGLDNHVVVQGQLLQSAFPLVPTLLALLAGGLSPWVRSHVLDLLWELSAGTEHPDEIAIGKVGLAERCRKAVSEGKWLYYQVLLTDTEEDANSRGAAMDLLVEFEEDRARLADVLRGVAAREPNEATRSIALERLKEVEPHAEG